MEKEGLIRSLDHLKNNGLTTIKTIVTDRHSGVAKFLKSKPEIDHRFDSWHMGKGIYNLLLFIKFVMRVLVPKIYTIS